MNAINTNYEYMIKMILTALYGFIGIAVGNAMSWIGGLPDVHLAFLDFVSVKFDLSSETAEAVHSYTKALSVITGIVISVIMTKLKIKRDKRKEE